MVHEFDVLRHPADVCYVASAAIFHSSYLQFALHDYISSAIVLSLPICLGAAAPWSISKPAKPNATKSHIHLSRIEAFLAFGCAAHIGRLEHAELGRQGLISSPHNAGTGPRCGGRVLAFEPPAGTQLRAQQALLRW